MKRQILLDARERVPSMHSLGMTILKRKNIVGTRPWEHLKSP